MTLHSKPQATPRSLTSGFTLLEVLIAFASASVVLVLVLSVLPAQSLRTQQRLDKLIGTELAYSLLEEYRLTGAPPSPIGKFENWSWSFTERSYDPGPGRAPSSFVSLFEVTVKITRSIRPDEVSTLSTVIARRLQ